MVVYSSRFPREQRSRKLDGNSKYVVACLKDVKLNIVIILICRKSLGEKVRPEGNITTH